MRQVLRMKVSGRDIAAAGNIEIRPSCQPRMAPNLEVVFNNIPMSRVEDPTANPDIVWKCHLLFGITRPGWSGLMQRVHLGEHRGQSSITFLPMIGLSLSDTTCINSTVEFDSC